MNIPPLNLIVRLAAAGALLAWPASIRAGKSEAPDTAGMQEIAKTGEGFLVWERALHGAKGDWQIWTRPLDPDGQEELLVPEEKGRSHFAPKLSPDGSKLAYLSYKRGQDAYNRKEAGSLWVMDLATHNQALMIKEAKCYQEDRAVVWFDNTRLCYLNGNDDTYELDLASGKSKRIVTEAHGKFGFLVNPTKTFATSGDPEFAPFDKDKGVVNDVAKFDGCQPYFSQDGKWGFWMSGVGGPISRFFLPLRTATPILNRNDPRLPPGRGYIYFPMISPCMRLFAFAASPDQHDHFTANYNLLVSRMDPDTLELIGSPVRYTFFKGTDRYPDVFAKPLPLGSHFTEGPAHVSFQSPGGQSCAWRVDGSAAGEGASLNHFFEKDGDHWVETEEGGKPLRGLVHVRHAIPPAIVSVVRDGPRSLVITFNKAVSLASAKAVAGNATLPWKGQTADDHMAALDLPPAYVSLQDILFSGVRDKAETPNELPPTRASVNLPPWPPFRDDVVFAWEDHQAAPLPPQIAIMPEAHGKSWWSAAGGLDAGGGWHDLPPAGDRMMHDCRKAHAITLEAIITPRAKPADKEAWPIFSLENKSGDTRFALLQRADGFYLLLATEQKNKDTSGEERLAPAVIGRPQHLVVGYANGVVTVMVNGVAVPVHSRLEGRLAFDKGPGDFHMGVSSGYPGMKWSGSVEHLACYNRIFDASEFLELYDYAVPKLTGRIAIESHRIMARLVEASRLPTLEEIKPYHEALVKNCYEVLPDNPAGEKQAIPAGTKVVVTHWVWLNGERARSVPAEIGKACTLLVEPVSAHPEVRSLYIKDDLSNGLGSDEYLDVGGW